MCTGGYPSAPRKSSNDYRSGAFSGDNNAEFRADGEVDYVGTKTAAGGTPRDTRGYDWYVPLENKPGYLTNVAPDAGTAFVDMTSMRLVNPALDRTTYYSGGDNGQDAPADWLYNQMNPEDHRGSGLPTPRDPVGEALGLQDRLFQTLDFRDPVPNAPVEQGPVYREVRKANETRSTPSESRQQSKVGKGERLTGLDEDSKRKSRRRNNDNLTIPGATQDVGLAAPGATSSGLMIPRT